MKSSFRCFSKVPEKRQGIHEKKKKKEKRKKKKKKKKKKKTQKVIDDHTGNEGQNHSLPVWS